MLARHVYRLTLYQIQYQIRLSSYQAPIRQAYSLIWTSMMFDEFSLSKAGSIGRTELMPFIVAGRSSVSIS